MGCNQLIRPFLLFLAFASFSISVAAADEPQGLSILLSDTAVRAKLKLPAERLAALDELLAKRAADQAKLAFDALKTSPQQLREQKLQDFQQASDKLLGEFVTAEEKETVESVRLSRVGFIALAEKTVQQRLRISDEQRTAIDEMLTERAAKLRGLDEDEALPIVAGFEIRLAKVLEAKQMLGWRTLIGEVDAEAAGPDVLARIEEVKPVAETKKVEAKPPFEGPRDDIKLTFSFGKEDWSEVIEWFADQAQLNLKMDSVPEGTLNYQDKTEYTVAEAMDFLNSLLLREDFTLIRNKQMLMVVNLVDGIPASVIETIDDPAELDKRGKYEIVKCVFHFKDVEGEAFSEEIEGLINTEKGQGNSQYFASTNSLIVQETGGTLRTIRTILETAEKRAAKTKRPIDSLVLKHVNVEELMQLARPFFGMKENENSVEKDDMRLTVVPEVFGQRLFISGSEEAVDRFKSLVEVYDVAGESASESVLEKNEFKTYAPQTDPVLIEQVLRRIFGTEEGMRLARNETTGFIVVEAKPSQHEKVKAAIESMESETATTELITLTKYEPADVIPFLKSLFHITETADGKTTGTLVLEEDPIQSRLIVRGTPLQVAEVKRIIQSIDPPIGSTEFQRSELRRIPVSGQAAARALESTAQIWPFMARENRITFVVPGKGEFNPADPKELKEMLGEQNIILPGRGEFDELPPESSPAENDSPGLPATQPEKSGDTPLEPEAEPKAKPEATSASFQKRNLARNYVTVAAQVPTPRPDDSDDKTAQPDDKTAQPTDSTAEGTKQESVPGADVMVQVNRSEIILYSKDLDALDALEQLLMEQGSSSIESEVPTIFLLEHRSAEEVKGILEEILGISSGGGAGAGGIGSMLGGMAQNMLGPAGGMVQGLLGGGTSSSSGVVRTTGDVTIVSDLKLNALIVFAIDEDLDKIKLLLKVIDQKEALQNPNLDGKTYKIPVVYVNAVELVDIVKAQLAARVKSAQQGGDGGQQNQQAQQMQMLQALMQGGRGGRGGRGGGADGGEQQSPQFSITAYDKANWILVTGPEFLYKQVEEIVLLLDTPSALARQPKVTVVPASGINPDLLAQALQAMYGDKVTTGTGSSSTARTGTTTGTTTQRSANDVRSAIMQRMQQGGGGFPGGGGGFPGGGGGFPGGGGFGGGGAPGGGGGAPTGGPAGGRGGR